MIAMATHIVVCSSAPWWQNFPLAVISTYPGMVQNAVKCASRIALIHCLVCIHIRWVEQLLVCVPLYPGGLLPVLSSCEISGHARHRLVPWIKSSDMIKTLNRVIDSERTEESFKVAINHEYSQSSILFVSCSCDVRAVTGVAMF